ncbi:MAG: helix-turn-helix transcriptional regulator [Lachnospiraceae bacterium]|nr:helix-turn-helix transcriptional regulator [Lachnospiraceae bacterium]
MDVNKFGCFLSERRKELKMTQKDLATEIQVTDKAVSKWERGLGFPDINTIEPLADVLNVSIIELMKSERANENVSIDETVVEDVFDIATKEVERKQTKILIILVITTFLCTLVEILQSIDWNVKELTMTAAIPYTALIPGFVTIIVSIIYKLKGEKTGNLIAIGVCMIIIPIILLLGVFLVLGLLTG